MGSTRGVALPGRYEDRRESGPRRPTPAGRSGSGSRSRVAETPFRRRWGCRLLGGPVGTGDLGISESPRDSVWDAHLSSHSILGFGPFGLTPATRKEGVSPLGGTGSPRGGGARETSSLVSAFAYIDVNGRPIVSPAANVFLVSCLSAHSTGSFPAASPGPPQLQRISRTCFPLGDGRPSSPSETPSIPP